MKKIYTLLIIFTLTFASFFCKFSVKATNDSSNLTNPSTEFRAAWVSYYTGDISYKNEKDYKNRPNFRYNGILQYECNDISYQGKS